MAERSWTVEVEDFDRDVFAHDPRHPRALLGLARLLAERGANDEALRLLERVSPSVPLAANAERLAAELRTRGGVDGDEPALTARAAAEPAGPHPRPGPAPRPARPPAPW